MSKAIIIKREHKNWNSKYGQSVFNLVKLKICSLISKHADEIEIEKTCRILELVIANGGIEHIQNREQVSALVDTELVTNSLDFAELILKQASHVDGYLNPVLNFYCFLKINTLILTNWKVLLVKRINHQKSIHLPVKLLFM